VPNVQRGVGVFNLPALSSSHDPCNFLDQITAAISSIKSLPRCGRMSKALELHQPAWQAVFRLLSLIFFGA
jgi:hypothetical protein